MLYIAVLHPSENSGYFALLNGPNDDICRWPEIEIAIENMAEAPPHYHEIFSTKLVTVPERFESAYAFVQEYLSKQFREANAGFGVIVIESNTGTYQEYGMGLDPVMIQSLYDEGIALYPED